jgi:hypothetical protein
MALVVRATKRLHCDFTHSGRQAPFDRAELIESPVGAAEFFENPKGDRTEHQSTYDFHLHYSLLRSPMTPRLGGQYCRETAVMLRCDEPHLPCDLWCVRGA